jgi:DNA repair protein RadD
VAEIVLRPYQVDAIRQIYALIREGVRRILLVMPTGSGKTLTSAKILSDLLGRGKKGLFCAHRVEIIDQTVTAFARLNILCLGVIRAKDKRRDASQPLQIASIQTLRKRDKPEAHVVFPDEAHISLSKSYQDHVFGPYKDQIIVGITATPIRGDGKPLGDAYERIVIGATYADLIEQGWLSDPLVYGTPVLPDLSHVHTLAGDYNEKELEEAVNKSALIGNVVDEWEKRAEGRRTVVFAVGIRHSLAIVAEFRARGHVAEHLDGTTPENERRSILARLASGETAIVSNVGVLQEGWDLPACKCLSLARPTKSLGLFMQQAGRILRPWCPCGCAPEARCPNQVRPIILDHGGNIDRHGLPTEDREWSLTKKVTKPKAASQKCCKTCFAYILSSAKVCPYCGHVFAVVQAEAPEEKEQLTGIELALRTLKGEDAQLAFWKAQVKKAREKGLRPGFVFHRYEERWGVPPPFEWSRALKKAAAKDSEWAEKLARRDTLPGTQW